MDVLAGDLFAGAGGLTLGAKLAGADVVFANDSWKPAATTYRANNPTTKFFPEPITELNPLEVVHKLGIARGDLDILLGGPPCQGFSIYAPLRSKEDKRNLLVLEYLRLVKGLMPKFLLLENVPGLLSLGGGHVLHWIYERLGVLGYNVQHRVLLSARYGVPQERWRLMVLAHRNDMPQVSFPQATHHAVGRPNFTGGAMWAKEEEQSVKRLKHIVTVRDAIGDLPVLRNGGGREVMMMPMTSGLRPYQVWARGEVKELWNHTAPRLGDRNLERLQYVPRGGNWRNIPHNLLPAGMKRAQRSDHTKRYGRLDPRGLSCTILTSCDPHWGSFFHYSQNRAITPREAARLQSFPDRYVFFGTRSAQYKQIGNAVPPLLAKAIVEQIVEALGRKMRRAPKEHRVNQLTGLSKDLGGNGRRFHKGETK